MNSTKTVILLGLLTGLLVAAGGALGGQNGMLIALVIAAAMNFFSYWFSDKIVLSMYGAQPITESQAPELYQTVRELATSANLPMPKVYVIEDATPNAFATGRDPQHAAVAVTSGIVDILDRRELRGVLAHELAHVKDRDILISSVAATIAGAVMVLANMARFGAMFGIGRSSDDDEGGGAAGVVGLILMSILAPIAAMLIQMAISRSREYLADKEGGTAIAHDPEALASALAKLEQANRQEPMADARPQTAHMFIVNPLSGGGLVNLFSTHPPIAERIARLRQMAGRGYTPPEPVSGGHMERPSFKPDSTPSKGTIDWS